MSFSPVGQKKVAGHGILLLVNIAVLAFSVRVNRFQEFFFAADLFPFGLAITTLVLLSSTIVLDFAISHAYMGRPQFEIGYLGLFSVLWLISNSFSTSRWSLVPMQCDTIPPEFSGERAWCKDLQALKALVWVEFGLFLLATVTTLRYSIHQSSQGYKHIWKMPLSRYRPETWSNEKIRYTKDSKLLQFQML